MLFCDYFKDFIQVYKKGSVRPVTYQKYEISLRRLAEIAPTLKISELNKRSYQSIINAYAQTHEKQTVFDFHYHLKSAVMNAMDEDIIKINPCRNTVIKGVVNIKNRKIKALSVAEFEKLLAELNLKGGVNWDWLIYLVAKTGARFAEAIGLTPGDFDFDNKIVSISKSLNYKDRSGANDFAPTKNKSSVRKIAIDDTTNTYFRILTAGKSANTPVFASPGKRVFNSTINNRLATLCKHAGIPTVSLHGLRHTHASVLFCNGVSVLSVSKRLGHSDVTTTQETYLHIIKELEDKDDAKITGFLSKL